jgi:hypothetical protein
MLTQILASDFSYQLRIFVSRNFSPTTMVKGGKFGHTKAGMPSLKKPIEDFIEDRTMHIRLAAL